MTEHGKKEIDQMSGVETTGHEWDGLKELNNPAPRWWLWVLYVTIIWSIGYWVLYPAWPTLSGATKGTLNSDQYKDLAASQAEIAGRQDKWLGKFKAASYEEILADDGLSSFARAGGAAAFKDNCATCHGSGASGGKGYPNLNDDDWLWGGKIEDIEQTLRYGVRSGHDEARDSAMPAFGKDALLKAEEIGQVADFVVAMSTHKEAASLPGAAVFAANCASCHGEKGEGVRDFGAPRLNDAIWLYGGTRADIYAQIQNPRHGVMPFWQGRLNDQTIRQLAVYVYSLGGGEKAAPVVAEPVSPTVESVAPVAEPEATPMPVEAAPDATAPAH